MAEIISRLGICKPASDTHYLDVGGKSNFDDVLNLKANLNLEENASIESAVVGSVGPVSPTTSTRYSITEFLNSLWEPFAATFDFRVLDAWIELNPPTGPDNFFRNEDWVDGGFRFMFEGEEYRYRNLGFTISNLVPGQPGGLYHLKLSGSDLVLESDPEFPGAYLVFKDMPSNLIGNHGWNIYISEEDNQVYTLNYLGFGASFGGGASGKYSGEVFGTEVTSKRYYLTEQLNTLWSTPGSSFGFRVIDAWLDLNAPTGSNSFFQTSNYVSGYMKYVWNNVEYVIPKLDFGPDGLRYLRLIGSELNLSYDASAPGSPANTIQFYEEDNPSPIFEFSFNPIDLQITTNVFFAGDRQFSAPFLTGTFSPRTLGTLSQTRHYVMTGLLNLLWGDSLELQGGNFQVIEAWLDLNPPSGPANFFRYQDYVDGYMKYTWQGVEYEVENLDFQLSPYSGFYPGMEHLKKNGPDLVFDADPESVPLLSNSVTFSRGPTYDYVFNLLWEPDATPIVISSFSFYPTSSIYSSELIPREIGIESIKPVEGGGAVNIGATPSTTTIWIGSGSHSKNIIIGNNSDTVTIRGTVTTTNSINLTVKDKLITLNKNGVASSAFESGIEFEENTLITAYIKTSTDRTMFDIKTPARSGLISLKPSTLGGSLVIESLSGISSTNTWTFPNVSDTVVGLASNQTLTNKTFSSVTMEGTTTLSGTLNSSASSTYSGTAIFNSGANFNGNVIFGDSPADTVSFVSRLGSSIVPTIDNTHTLGNSPFRWAKVWTTELDASGTLTVGGQLTANGNVVIGNANTDTVSFTARVNTNLEPATNNARALGSSSLRWSKVWTQELDAAGALTVAGQLTANGNVVIGNANTDTVSFTARVNTNLEPATNNARALGSSGLRWSKVWAKEITITDSAVFGGSVQADGIQSGTNSPFLKWMEFEGEVTASNNNDWFSISLTTGISGSKIIGCFGVWQGLNEILPPFRPISNAVISRNGELPYSEIYEVFPESGMRFSETSSLVDQAYVNLQYKSYAAAWAWTGIGSVYTVTTWNSTFKYRVVIFYK